MSRLIDTITQPDSIIKHRKAGRKTDPSTWFPNLPNTVSLLPEPSIAAQKPVSWQLRFQEMV